MSAKKIIVVFGATGNQGGSVIKSFLNDPKATQEFKIRGITRDPSKPNAKALAEKGVETVTGDINDKESLKGALEGAHTVFALTNYWEKLDDKLEIQQGKNVADVSKEVGVQHLIFSVLYNVTEMSGGKYSAVAHFDSKATVEQYIRSLGIPASFFMPGFYMSNLDNTFRPSQQEPHAYTLALPMPPTTPVPFFDAADDTGKFVKAMAMKRDQILGKSIFAATAYYRIEEVASTFAQVKPKVGKGAQFVTIDKDTYTGQLAQIGLPPFAQEELYENMAFMNEFGYYKKQSLDESLAFLDGEKPTTLAEYFEKSPKFKDLE